MTIADSQGASGVGAQGRHGRPPADNNVQDVISAIDNYTCGPVRALAQDPPQNAADAQHHGALVRVEYRLYQREHADGSPFAMLTITDSGTTGLDGPVLTQDDLQQRELQLGELVIQAGENWAAWEAMRYTKSGEDKLGSRGQGKYAYLYHSAHPVPGASSNAPRHAWRMIILYDTLLPGGEYRLGVRYHNPSTKVIEPPFVDDEARATVAGTYRDEFFEIPLELDPLTEPGTRVIIPFLGEEACDAIASGEFVHWLTAEWWRKIQKVELEIELTVDSAPPLHIGVPTPWAGQPWEQDDARYFVREDLPLASNSASQPRKLKRVVLFQDDDLENGDLAGPAQMNGVQLLRGGQWITTLEISEFSDWIPREHRDGFRGFVEFERRLERELREIENPAHDGFNKRTSLYREIVQSVRDLVKEFARARGWFTENDDHVPEPAFDDLVRELAELFVAPATGHVTPSDVEWSAAVELTFAGDSNVVQWGETVDVSARCVRTPALDGPDIEFQAALIRPDGTRVPILSRRSQALRSRPGGESSSAMSAFGALAVDHPHGNPAAPFQGAGRYSIEVVCELGGQEVTRGRASFYVATAPPPPPARELTLQLEASNATDGGTRIEYGDEMASRVTIRNYGVNAAACELAVAVEDSPYVLRRQSVSVDGAPVGGGPQREIVVLGNRKVVEVDDGDPTSLVLAPGAHTIMASLEHGGAVVASATATILVGPADEEGGDLPFEVSEVHGNPTAPRWSLEDPGLHQSTYVLKWSSEDPIYRGVRTIQRPPAGAVRLPVLDFVAQVIAEGLVEWAVREYHSRGDEGRLRLVGTALAAANQELAERFEDRIERLMSATENPSEYGAVQRELAAIMLEASRSPGS